MALTIGHNIWRYEIAGEYGAAFISTVTDAEVRQGAE